MKTLAITLGLAAFLSAPFVQADDAPPVGTIEKAAEFAVGDISTLIAAGVGLAAIGGVVAVGADGGGGTATSTATATTP